MMTRLRSGTSLLAASCLLLLTATGRAQKVSAADLLTVYADWVHGDQASAPMVAIDLDAARGELGRLAATFLMPIEGAVTKLRGTCPALTFTLSGTTVSTGPRTKFAGGTCAGITNAATLEVIRQTDASLPAARVTVELAGDLTAQTMAQTGQSATPRPRTQVPDEGQRQLLTTFALELAASGSKTQAAAATRLVEWACAYVRSHAPQNDFDRAWQLAALAVIEGGIDSRALAAHLDHVESFRDPRLALARAIVEEQSTAPAEAVFGQFGGVDAERATLLFARTGADHARAAERAAAEFQAVAAGTSDASVRGEANLRLGHVLLEAGRDDDALAAMAGVDRDTTEPALVYLLHLFRGLALEGRGRAGEARASYARALDVSPGAHSATLRLAALVFRDGQTAEADRLLNVLLRDDDPRRDSWWSYYAADWRFWYPRVDRVRAMLRTAANGTAGDR